MRFPAALIVFSLVTGSASYGDIVLSGTEYFQNFDGIGSGLPSGITVRTGATSASLGTAVTFDTSPNSWGSMGGDFKNLASVTGQVSTATTTTQSNATDRALGVRQTGAFGDPGASFTFQVQDTLGFQGLTLSFQYEMASVQPRSTSWSVQWALGAAPTTFSLLDTITDPGAFGESAKSYALPATVNNQSSNLWIRVAALTASSGSDSRDTSSIDNLRLTYSAVPEASVVVFGILLCAVGGLHYGRQKLLRRARNASL